MAFKPWSAAFAWLVVFGLFGLAGFGAVNGTRLLFLIGAALAAPALVLRASADVTPSSDEKPGQVPRVGGAIPTDAAA